MGFDRAEAIFALESVGGDLEATAVIYIYLGRLSKRMTGIEVPSIPIAHVNIRNFQRCPGSRDLPTIGCGSRMGESLMHSSRHIVIQELRFSCYRFGRIEINMW
jgi:hypothetical protein